MQENHFKSESFFLLPSVHLRSALNAQGAHAVHAQLAHVHALVADLDHATLEVLLVEHVHLVAERMSQYARNTPFPELNTASLWLPPTL